MNRRAKIVGSIGLVLLIAGLFESQFTPNTTQGPFMLLGIIMVGVAVAAPKAKKTSTSSNGKKSEGEVVDEKK